METTKQFRKRNAILACLRGTTCHPSAEKLYQMLQQEHPDISLATVYRNLALFKSQGIIASVATVGGVERFDGNIEPHVHFICSGCGAVLDVTQVDQPDYSSYARFLGCRIDQTQLTFTGLCRECLNTPEETPSNKLSIA
mgnify:FL=1